jgi:YidC/Oxa1 family membrane protein insertase
MPIFFAMVAFFPAAFELRQQSFLWAKDLSTYDDLIRWGFHIPILGDHLSLFALMTALTTLAYTVLSPQSTSTTTPGMKWLPYLTPVIFFLFLNSYSAALSWYYTVLNVLTIGQTLLMRRLVDKEAIIRKLRARRQKKTKQGTSRQQQLPRWLQRGGKRR